MICEAQTVTGFPGLERWEWPGCLIRDLDKFRPASILIREHGEEANLEAAIRADTMLEKVDMVVC